MKTENFIYIDLKPNVKAVLNDIGIVQLLGSIERFDDGEHYLAHFPAIEFYVYGTDFKDRKNWIQNAVDLLFSNKLINKMN